MVRALWNATGQFQRTLFAVGEETAAAKFNLSLSLETRQTARKHLIARDGSKPADSPSYYRRLGRRLVCSPIRHRAAEDFQVHHVFHLPELQKFADSPVNYSLYTVFRLCCCTNPHHLRPCRKARDVTKLRSVGLPKAG